MKRFGYLRDYMHFNIYNTTKMLYVNHPVYGVMELPKRPTGKKSFNVSVQANNYAKRLEYEKYLNPKGLKPTVTSQFPQPQQKLEFTNMQIYRIPCNKKYGPGTMCFRSAPGLSKPEVKQFLTKLYDLPILSIRSVIRLGKIRKVNPNTYAKQKDSKKWIVKVALKKKPKSETNEEQK